NVTRYDQGPFRCRVFNPVSDGTSDPVNLFISCELLICIFLQQNTNNKTLKPQNSNFTFVLFVTASDRVQLTDGNSTLTIINVTRYDQGPFRCRAFNPVSNGTSDPVNLSISFGPDDIHLNKSSSNENYLKGSNIDLTCSADSKPSAQFKWFLNGSLLSDTGPKLRLTNIQKNQSGNYICQAFNNKTLRYRTSQPTAITVVGKSLLEVVLFVSRGFHSQPRRVLSFILSYSPGLHHFKNHQAFTF
uniref:Ig-like domain-containing protein n=1 Tax=Anabas testudineus TaxID=64144 RepID=A0A7N6FHC1_ANATE